MNKKVTVLGATGYTGQLIVSELQRLKIPFNVAGRNKDKLEQLTNKLRLDNSVTKIVADSLRSDSLPPLFQNDTGVLVNCAGPFTHLGESVVKEAVKAGVHYLDITGEQGFVSRVFDQYDMAAQLKGCALIPACGVEFALSNWLAALAAKDLGPLESIVTATNVISIKPTSGTQLSLFKALSTPTLGWENGKRVRRLTGTQWRSFKFPSGSRNTVWSPFSEPITLPRQFQVKNVASYMVLPAPLAVTLRYSAPFVPMLSRVIGSVFDRTLKSGKGPSEEIRKAAKWEIVAEVESAKSKVYASLIGLDAYGLTANIVGYAVEKILQPEFQATGALGPSQAFEAQSALDYLRDFGVTYEVKMV